MDKALSALGMAMRAGQLVTGDETVLKAIRAGKAHLVLVAGDASANTKKKFADKCLTFGAKIIVAYTRAELGAAIGKEERVIIGVTERGFAKLISSHMSDFSEVDNID